MNFGASQFDVDKAVRGGMAFSAIVDINGVHNPKTGGFHVVQDALDAGHQSIFVRDGTYPSFDIDGNHNTIIGESWGAVIDGGTENDHAIDINGGTGNRIFNLSAKKTGGTGNAKDTFYVNGDYGVIAYCQVGDADEYGIVLYQGGNLILGNWIAAGDDHQLYVASSLNRVIGNQGASTAGLGIYVSGDNNVVVGNNAADSIQIASGGDYNNVSANLAKVAVTNLGANNEIAGANKIYV